MKVVIDNTVVEKNATEVIVVTNEKEFRFTDKEFNSVYLNSKEIVTVAVK